MEDLGRHLTDRGVSREAIELVGAAHARSSTYNSQWRKWVRWCQRGRIPPWRPDEVNLANYLASEFARGVGSGSAASARSAITSTWRLGVGRVPEEGGIVTALMRGFK